MRNPSNKKYFIGSIFGVLLLGLIATVPFAVRSRTVTIGASSPVVVSESVATAENSPKGIATASSPGSPNVTTNTGAGAVFVAPKADGALPAKLVIPKLGIRSNVQSVGLTPQGDMDIAHSAVDVAWYKLGPKPGEIGSAVINGHINTYYSDHGVFEHLDYLGVGDVVMVERQDGKVLRFVVTGKKTFDYDAPGDEVFAPVSGRHLNLITCAGEWMKDKQLYEKRLVIFTELEQ